MSIHPTAIIADGAVIHETVQIGPYAVIGPNVKIGAGTRVGAHAVLDGHTTIGEDCRLFAGASVGLEPQDLSYKGEPTGVILGNRVTLREYATVHRGTGDRFTTVGDDCFFMNYSHIAHDCTIGKGVILANGATFGGHCVVGDYVVGGGLVVFHQHVKVGRMVMISGITGTRADLPPFSICDDRPARVVGVNAVGMRRQKFSAETRSAIKSAYKLIYRSGLNYANALARIEAELPPLPELKEIVDFYRASKRGVVKGGFGEESSEEDG
ncbi:MAG: acyl-ACP--UDP-N-acetylglucosamine O-acyltransferase [Cyanobacteria bacterium SZAS LIN-2]|nr:acyl-ACP--UDP-N-acetylglucosamine O-acyltransferase [Cyanobacteria bacterium SZAS LIN-2]